MHVAGSKQRDNSPVSILTRTQSRHSRRSYQGLKSEPVATCLIPRPSHQVSGRL